MRAAYIQERTGAAGIRLGTLARPSCGPGQVLIRVQAVAVNNVDTFVRSGRYATDLVFPQAVGRDATGIVAQTCTGVEGLRAGDAVWTNSLGFDGRPGAAAEFALADAERVYRLPSGAAPVEAAAALHPCATASLALERHGALRAGETAYIAGGAGHVGSAAVVLAAATGARVLASAAPQDAAYCRTLGAAEVFDYRAPDLQGQLRAAAPGGIDVHLDTSGANDLELAVGLMARRGRIVIMAGTSSRAMLPAGDLYMNDVAVLGFAISNADAAELSGAAATVNRMLADRLWRPRRLLTLPLEAAAAAHAMLEEGRARGTRIVLLPGAGQQAPGD